MDPVRHFAATYAEVDFLMFNWLNLHTEYNYVKFGGGNPLERWVIGFDPFIDRFIQPRILYRANMGPGSQPDVNQPQLWIELHTFFNVERGAYETMHRPLRVRVIVSRSAQPSHSSVRGIWHMRASAAAAPWAAVASRTAVARRPVAGR